jgi:hypothetical protein
MTGRGIARTENGYIRAVPANTQSGDQTGLFKGAKVPLIRRLTSSGRELIGDGYIYGIMHGEKF